MAGKVVSIVNDKGGVSKSTSTIALGDYYVQQGKKVAIADVDPRHQCLEWAAMANAAGRETPLMVGNHTNSVSIEIQKLQKHYDIVIVDGMSSFVASNRRDMIAGVISCSDFVFIPTEPNVFDFWAIAGFADLIKARQEINNGSPVTFMYGARVRPNTTEWSEFLAMKDECPFPVLEPFLPLDVAFPRTMGEGCTPLSLPDSHKAKKALIKWAETLNGVIYGE